MRWAQRLVWGLGLVLIGMGPAPLQGQTLPVIAQIRLEGAHLFSEAEILGWLSMAAGDPFQPDRLDQGKRRLLARYHEAGYWNATIQVLPQRQDEGQVIVAVRIEEGKPCRLVGIQLSGNQTLPSAMLLDEMDLRPGAIFRPQTLEQDLKRLLGVYENWGFPYCHIAPGAFRITGGGLAFQLHIEEGPRVRMGALKIQGNHVTRAQVINRAFGFKAGAYFDRRFIDQGVARLQRTGFFNRVTWDDLMLSQGGDSVTVVIAVEEAQTGAIDGVLGYVPGTANRAGFFSGLIDLSLHNLAGTGRQIDAGWQRLDPYSSRLHFRYVEPWVFNSPLDLEVNLEQVAQDSSYAMSTAGTAIRFPWNNRINGQLGLRWRRVVPDSGAVDQVVSSRTYSVQFGLGFDSRDNPWNPREGASYQAELEYGTRVSDPGAVVLETKRQVRLTRLQIHLETFIPVFQRQVIALGLHGFEVRGGEPVLPQADQFRLGGASTLRGYRENAFLGHRVAWSNLEYRFLLNRRSRFFLFMDAGYIASRRQIRPGEPPLDKSLGRLGYGVGLRLTTRTGILGIDYGLGQGDHPLEGKLHFRLRNQF